VTGRDRPYEVVKEDPPMLEEPQSPLMRFGLTVLRFLAAIAVPIVAFTILWLSFEWLRQADVNRAIIVGGNRSVHGSSWALPW